MARSELKVMGKVLGTYDGWDGEMPAFAFYNFQPNEGINIQAGDLGIHYEDGMFDVSNPDTGDIHDTGSLIPFLL